MKNVVYYVLEWIVEFICMYLPLHLIYYYVHGVDQFAIMFLISLLLGVGVTIISQKLHRNMIGMVYLIALFLIVLVVSAGLFYGAPYQGWLRVAYLYFPQLVIIAYMIPGLLCYVFLKSIFTVKLSHKRNMGSNYRY